MFSCLSGITVLSEKLSTPVIASFVKKPDRQFGMAVDVDTVCEEFQIQVHQFFNTSAYFKNGQKFLFSWLTKVSGVCYLLYACHDHSDMSPFSYSKWLERRREEKMTH